MQIVSYQNFAMKFTQWTHNQINLSFALRLNLTGLTNHGHLWLRVSWFILLKTNWKRPLTTSGMITYPERSMTMLGSLWAISKTMIARLKSRLYKKMISMMKLSDSSEIWKAKSVLTIRKWMKSSAIWHSMLIIWVSPLYYCSGCSAVAHQELYASSVF